MSKLILLCLGLLFTFTIGTGQYMRASDLIEENQVYMFRVAPQCGEFDTECHTQDYSEKSCVQACELFNGQECEEACETYMELHYDGSQTYKFDVVNNAHCWPTVCHVCERLCEYFKGTNCNTTCDDLWKCTDCEAGESDKTRYECWTEMCELCVTDGEPQGLCDRATYCVNNCQHRHEYDDEQPQIQCAFITVTS